MNKMNENETLKFELSYYYVMEKCPTGIRLQQYNADRQEFSLQTDNETLNIFIPIDIAPQFKKEFMDKDVPYVVDQIYIDKKKAVVAKCHIVYNEKKYDYQMSIRIN